MPYDPAKTKQLMKLVGAYASHPLGELVGQLAAQLTEAEGEIRNATSSVVNANAAREKSEAGLAMVEQTIARLRSGSTGMNDLIDALKSISLNPKGAAKTATAALAKVNGTNAS